MRVVGGEEWGGGMRQMEVRLCEQVFGEVAAACGEAPVGLVAPHGVDLGGGVITLSVGGGGGGANRRRTIIVLCIQFFCSW